MYTQRLSGLPTIYSFDWNHLQFISCAPSLRFPAFLFANETRAAQEGGSTLQRSSNDHLTPTAVTPLLSGRLKGEGYDGCGRVTWCLQDDFDDLSVSEVMSKFGSSVDTTAVA